MQNERWQRVETLYHAALEREPTARRRFLVEACAGDESLRREVETLLAYDGKAASFIEVPAAAMLARDLADDSQFRRQISETLPAPTEVGRYRVLEPLGRGGMGEVHLALDTRLNRKVAIKLLPAEFTADAARVRRFEQEAQAVSALNHPNIVTVYEIGELDDWRYIVTEYVEGKTLRQLLADAPQSRLRLAQALDIAAQTASALQTAHEAGITHRDIKPENVMVRKDGLVKILDFGLAKVSRQANESPFAALERVSTQSGMVMGTVTYMSPEQARGEKVDSRTDIFSLGVILYEMLCGEKPFTGQTTSDVIVALLTKDPLPLRELTPEASVALESMVARCLEKEPEQRFQSAGDLGFALQALNSQTLFSATAKASALRRPLEQSETGDRSEERDIVLARLGGLAQRWFGRLLLASVAAVFLAALLLAAKHLGEAPVERLPVAFRFTLPENWHFREADAPTVSPNGRHIIFSASPAAVAADGNVARRALWLRNLDASEASILPGSEGGVAPFWSPDSRFVAFWANGRLQKIEPGGSSIPICETDEVYAGAWSQDGVILFSHTPLLQRVAATGGRAVSLEPFADGEIGQLNPRFLPDGKHFLYYSLNQDRQHDGLYIAALGVARQRKLLLKDAAAACYVAQGYLLFTKGEALMAQRFDLSRLEMEGEAMVIAEQVASPTLKPPDIPLSAFSASDNGILTWKVKSAATRGMQLTWFDRAGRQLGTLGEVGNYTNPALAPDEKYVAVGRADARSGRRDLWVMDILSNAGSRLTLDPADDFNPVWSPDGKFIYFTSTRQGRRHLYRKAVGGTGEALPILETIGDKSVEDISPDGKFLLYNFQPEGGAEPDLYLLPLSGAGAPAPLFTTEWREDQAQFSPDGRWLAYRASQPKNSAVYVRRVGSNGSRGGGEWQASENGGCQPRWRADGKELFYLNGNTLMAVEVKADANAVSFGTPTRLFKVNIEEEQRRNRYLVSKDGQRFLVVAVTEANGGSTIAVRANWLREEAPRTQ